MGSPTKIGVWYSRKTATRKATRAIINWVSEPGGDTPSRQRAGWKPLDGRNPTKLGETDVAAVQDM